MDKKILKLIKGQLLARKARIEKELKEFAKKDKYNQDNYRANFPEFGDKEDENIAEVAMFSDRLSLEGTLERLLRDINNALKRIKEGTYGRCKYCDQEIPEKRLLARSISSSCVKCKESLKSKR